MAFKLELLFTVAIAFAALHGALAGDPDITSDFLVPPNVTAVNATFFTFAGAQSIFQTPMPPSFKVIKASLAEFPALDGQSVSYAILQFPNGSVNPPQTHTRSAELLFLLAGCSNIKQVDS